MYRLITAGCVLALGLLTPIPAAEDKAPDNPASGGGGQIAGSPEIALKLKYVHQDELKTMVFEYHRSDAAQRTYAPQGFFGLMLNDLNDEEKHFVEVDLVHGRAVHTRLGFGEPREDAGRVRLDAGVETARRDQVQDGVEVAVGMLVATVGIAAELYNPGAILPGVAGVIAAILALVALSGLPVNVAGANRTLWLQINREPPKPRVLEPAKEEH